ncbi:MAG: hypothetical protein ACUVQG_02815 [Thermogutta sp.]
MRRMIVVGLGVGLVLLTIGCQRCNLFRRGALFAPTAAVPAAVIECPPVNPCDETVEGAACDPCTPTTTVVPPTSTFVPGPAG